MTNPQATNMLCTMTHNLSTKSTSKTASASRVFAALMFVLIVGVLLVAMLSGTRVYSALQANQSANNDARVALSLATNSVRANDAIDMVAVGEGPEGRALILRESGQASKQAGGQSDGQSDGQASKQASDQSDGQASEQASDQAKTSQENVNAPQFETRIYLYQGHIVEEYALVGAPCTPEKATQLADSQTFDFSYKNGLLTFVCDQGTSQVALHSVRGGADA